MRVSVIDIGTNSVKLTAAERGPGATALWLEDTSTVVGLGEGLERSGGLSREASLRAQQVVTAYAAAARAMGAETIRVLATSAVREAVNGDAFVASLETAAGVQVEVISGEAEGRLSFAAVARDPQLQLSDSRLAVVDIGGGSTEVITGRSNAVESVVSLPLGAVRLTDKFIHSDPPSDTELAAAAHHVDGVIRPGDSPADVIRVAGVGGTVINLARILAATPESDTASVHGRRFAAQDLARCLAELARMNLEARKSIVGLEPERAATIVAGGIILLRAITALKAPELTVSTRGLRHAVIYKMLGII